MLKIPLDYCVLIKNIYIYFLMYHANIFLLEHEAMIYKAVSSTRKILPQTNNLIAKKYKHKTSF